MSEEKKIKLDPQGHPTKAQLAEWKKEHGAFTVLSTEDGKFLALKDPTMIDVEKAMKIGRDPKSKPLDQARSIVGTCRIWESPGLMDNDSRALGIFAQVDEVITIQEVTAKKY